MIDILANAERRIDTATRKLNARIDLKCAIQANRDRVASFLRQQDADVAVARCEFFKIKLRTRAEIAKGVPPWTQRSKT